MLPHHQHAVLHAQPLINARRKNGGMRIVIDNRACGEDDLCGALALVSEVNAGAKSPLIVAFADDRLPAALPRWRPPAHTFPELRSEWLTQATVRDLLDGGNNPSWCLNGAPGRAPDPALYKTLAYTVAAHVPGPAADGLRVAGRPTVRTGVRTHADTDALFAKGINWVAGWPLQTAAARDQGRRAGNRMHVVRLLQLVQADADIGEIETLLRQDVGLAFKLLRFINSAANGLPIQVESFRHAVMILGYKQLTRWLALLVLASGEDPNQMPLISLSLRRGFFMERIGKRLFEGISPVELFMTGLFSLLNQIFAQPFEELLEQVHLPEAVSNSLRDHGEPYGPLLRLAQTTEGDDSTALRDSAHVLGLAETDVNRALLQAIRDTDHVELH